MYTGAIRSTESSEVEAALVRKQERFTQAGFSWVHTHTYHFESGCCIEANCLNFFFPFLVCFTSTILLRFIKGRFAAGKEGHVLKLGHFCQIHMQFISNVVVYSQREVALRLGLFSRYSSF